MRGMTAALAGAIDLGGTKILAAVVDRHGKIRGADRRSTEPELGPAAGTARMAESLLAACAQAGVPPRSLVGLGVAAAGPIDLATGVLSSPPNLPGWIDVPLAQILAESTGLSVQIENDANAAALGELVFGAGRGSRHMVYLTLSTGIGGGVIADGRILHGATGAAGEVGHIPLVPDGPLCGCGQRGCLEALASGTAIGREGTRAAAEGRSAVLAAMADPDGRVSAESVALAATRGDGTAAAIIAGAAEHLGVGLVTLVHLFNPELIVIGGGVSEIGAPLLGPAEVYMRAHSFPRLASAVRVVRAAHSQDAAVLGAAALALQPQPEEPADRRRGP